jgi:plasmid stabilization system protein ParE
MSSYTVIWTPAAEQQLAAIWVAARDREAVTKASAEIDEALTQEPETKGRPLAGGGHQFTSGPLIVLFVVKAADRIVEVLSVKRQVVQSNGQVS